MTTLDLDDMTIGKKLAHLLVDLDIEQKDVAARTGISEASISRWASGKRSKISHGDALKLALALDVNLYWLCDDSQGYPPPPGDFIPLGSVDVPPSSQPNRGNKAAVDKPDAPPGRTRKR